ncbi:hypothetical protein EDD85DRAFT_951692 [Armillaria nabsnona]|nr:hypothetical protein EDD85DRAFT_951692 [Armillaria nabsnona]
MCRRRHVRNVYLRCGHAINLPEEIVRLITHSLTALTVPRAHIYHPLQIRCEQSNCKFSFFHPASCKPPACQQTCWQHLRYPEQYSPNINGYCPFCAQAMGYYL